MLCVNAIARNETALNFIFYNPLPPDLECIFEYLLIYLLQCQRVLMNTRVFIVDFLSPQRDKHFIPFKNSLLFSHLLSAHFCGF